MTTYRRVVTGVSTLIFIVRQLCKLLTRYRTKIDAWAQGALAPGSKATLDSWLDGATAVCLILEAAPDD